MGESRVLYRSSLCLAFHCLLYSGCGFFRGLRCCLRACVRAACGCFTRSLSPLNLSLPFRKGLDPSSVLHAHSVTTPNKTAKTQRVASVSLLVCHAMTKNQLHNDEDAVAQSLKQDVIRQYQGLASTIFMCSFSKKSTQTDYFFLITENKYKSKGLMSQALNVVLE